MGVVLICSSGFGLFALQSGEYRLEVPETFFAPRAAIEVIGDVWLFVCAAEGCQLAHGCCGLGQILRAGRQFAVAVETGGQTVCDLRVFQAVAQEFDTEGEFGALVLRGDLRASQNQLEPAVLDYLRTVVFYQDEPCRAEAMYKAAETLAKMRDARAKDWYRQVITEYPESPYATQAKGIV